MSFPMEYQAKVHLLSEPDLTPEDSAGELVRADGSRQPLSPALLLALEHVVMIAGSNQSVRISPVEQRIHLRTAAALTAMSEQQFRDLVHEGQLDFRPDALGGSVALADVVALDQQFREKRHAWLADQLADDVQMLDGQTVGDLDHEKPDSNEHR